jgi:hypothetical protein
MTTASSEKRYLRAISKAESRVKEWESLRSGIILGIVLSGGLMLAGIAGVVTGWMVDSSASVAVFVPSGIALPVCIGAYCIVRWLYWTNSGSYSRPSNGGPYVQLQEARDDYEDYLDAMADRR